MTTTTAVVDTRINPLTTRKAPAFRTKDSQGRLALGLISAFLECQHLNSTNLEDGLVQEGGDRGKSYYLRNIPDEIVEQIEETGEAACILSFQIWNDGMMVAVPRLFIDKVKGRNKK